MIDRRDLVLAVTTLCIALLVVDAPRNSIIELVFTGICGALLITMVERARRQEKERGRGR